MDRNASVVLRRKVDAAVGPQYDTLFLRLDLLTTSREGRCGCDACRAVVDRRHSALLASLPALA